MATWNHLPEPAILNVFTNLSLSDRLAASQVCKEWSYAIYAPEIWRTFQCCFNSESDSKYLKFIKEYGEFMEYLTFEVDQFEPTNRETCLSAINLLTRLERRSLRKLRVKFMGDNPFFYAGAEFVKSLENLLGYVPLEDDRRSRTLEIVDFGSLPVSFDNTIIECLAKNHKNLRKLDIQNGQLVNRVEPKAILNLVKNCRCLSDLHVYKNSLSTEALMELAEKDRTPLEHLSTISRSEERFLLDIPSEVWLNLSLTSPDVKVTMKFDHTCLIEKVVDVLKYEIPLAELWLETYTMLHPEVVDKCLLFRERLNKLVLISPLQKASTHFEETLMRLTDQLTSLRSLHVFTVVKEDTKNHILMTHPQLVKCGSFTLRCEQGLNQWIPGIDCYDQPSHFF